MRPRKQPPTETQFIEKIQRITCQSASQRRGVALSIGDDTAALRIRSDRLLLVSCDAVVEGVHFDLNYFSPEDLGWKALAVNLSDIASMGGIPLYATTSIALPMATPVGFVEKVYRGLAMLAAQHRVALIGGDTCSSRHGVFLDVTIIGEVHARRMVTRGGARPGDLLYVTGELGGSAMGLELLAGRSRLSRHISSMVRRHLRPQPRCAAGRFLAGQRLASAMIDISDGLSTDLHHLCERSMVGAMIYSDRIPLPRVPSSQINRFSSAPLSYALNGGEDYELLFTVPQRLRRKVPRSIRGLPVHEIGHITSETGVCWLCQGGRRSRLSPCGFDHFRDGHLTASHRAIR
jgi:thiamine-monophosphate kinase